MKKVMIFLILLFVFFLTACGSKNTTSELNDAQNVKEFDIIAKQWSFEPDTIIVDKGDMVKLRIKSVDVDHGISIPEFGVNERLKSGKTVKVEFVADKTGTFTFFCNVICGAGHNNMRGTLIVR